MEILQTWFGVLGGVNTIAAVAGCLIVFAILAFTGASFRLWVLMGAAALYGWGAPMWGWITLAAVAVLLGIPPIRQILLTAPIVKALKALNFLPVISDTERTAIEAGNTWVDGDLFSGKPDFRRLMKETYARLTAEEQAFLDGPVEELCRICNDWKVYQIKDLPKEAWDLIKKEKFFGLVIPKKYGGHGFSPSANSAVVAKLISRSGPLGTTVMVPNSLGPAELILHYGTDAQKKYYLPRLARAEEIPCFALTEPGAGSDAGSMTSRGVIFKGEDGKLYMRLNWNKRYITLAAISTVLGLAFKLHDPDNLLGRGEDVGITCALVPTDTEGVVLGRRHDPLGTPFYNCPTEGHDVILPVDAIIGGAEQAGNGWRMLMESLAVGRGISLPASGVGGVKYAARVVGAYAKVRQQFGLSIGKFQGIEEPLARIGGFAYLLEAARSYTCGGLDSGQKPAVITAIAKYNFTELLRKAVLDGMDVLGGAAISRGPRNLLAHGYYALPINITVEGANILTRTLMIFGQGAIRSHPYAYQEIKALMENDLKGFDRAFWKHLGHVVRNGARALLLSLSRGRLASSPVSGPTACYYRKLAWASASFAFLADMALGSYGGNLKRMEKISGRFADIFSWLYLGTAVLRRYEADGRKKEDLVFVHWCMNYAFAQMQQAFDGLYQNMGGIFRGPVSWWSRLNAIGSMPADRLGGKIAEVLQTPGAQRDALTNGIFISKDVTEAMGRLENAFNLICESEPVLKKVYSAARKKQIAKGQPRQMVEAALAAGIITREEADLLARAEAARTDAVQVDSFTLEEYQGMSLGASNPVSAARSRPELVH